MNSSISRAIRCSLVLLISALLVSSCSSSDNSNSENLNPSIYDEDESRFTWGLSEILTIEVDVNGMGSVYEYFEEGDPSNMTTITENANRNTSDRSIIWSGTVEGSGFSGDFRSDQQFSIETMLAGESARKQIVESVYENWGSSDSRITTVSYTLTGSPVENSSTCNPKYGSYTTETNYKTNSGKTDTKTTVAKGLEDAVWLVTMVTPDGEAIEEYRASSLGVEFYCAFRGLK